MIITYLVTQTRTGQLYTADREGKSFSYSSAETFARELNDTLIVPDAIVCSVHAYQCESRFAGKRCEGIAGHPGDNHAAQIRISASHD